jgi:hypothetical protein
LTCVVFSTDLWMTMLGWSKIVQERYWLCLQLECSTVCQLLSPKNN